MSDDDCTVVIERWRWSALRALLNAIDDETPDLVLDHRRVAAARALASSDDPEVWGPVIVGQLL